jgi:Secretion system C-terminal sorting domain
MKKLILITMMALIGHCTSAQFTMVPDPVFEQLLIDEGIDTDGIINGQFLTANALGVDFLSFDYLPIENTTGLEAFVDLERLDARECAFDEIDLSQNTLLNQLTITYNDLNGIDLSNNVLLTTVFLDYCGLTEIDVSQNVNLIQLYMLSNELTEIDLSNNIALTSIWLSENNLTDIDLSNNVNLNGIHLDRNQLTSLDLSNNPALLVLEVYENQLTSLDLSNNPLLAYFACSENQLSSLDVSNNTELGYLNCAHNQLTEIIFSTVDNLHTFFPAGNQLTEINLPYAPSLVRYYLFENQVTEIDLSILPALKYLAFYDNLVDIHLDFTNNPYLEWFYGYNNPIPSLDVMNCPNLDRINASNTLLTSIDLSNNILNETVNFKDTPLLEYIDIRNGNNENLHIVATNSPNLSCIIVDDVSSGNGIFTIDPHTTLVNSMEECQALEINDLIKYDIVVTPNPFSDTISIQSAMEIEEIQVFTLTGQLVRRLEANSNYIFLGDLSSGLYLLRVSNKNQSEVIKIIKL